MEPDYYVYTDGACIHNGRENASAGIGIFFAEGDPRNVSRKIDGKQSNNMAELTAILETYPLIQEDIRRGKRITIVTDSKYALLCLTTYGEKCAKHQWSQDIPNKEWVQHAYELYKSAPSVQFLHVKAHTSGEDVHSVGNRWADQLATQGAQGADRMDQCTYERDADANIKKVFMDVQKPRIYLNVPYAQKETAKRAGAKWDVRKKKWYINEDHPWKEDLLCEFSIE